MEHFAAGINYRVHCNILKHSVVMGQHYCVKGELGWVRFSHVLVGMPLCLLILARAQNQKNVFSQHLTQ